MIKATKDFPLYDTQGKLVNYKAGDIVDVNDKALSEKLILCGKCTLHDPRKKEDPIENKVLETPERKIEKPAKKKRSKK